MTVRPPACLPVPVCPSHSPVPRRVRRRVCIELNCDRSNRVESDRVEWKRRCRPARSLSGSPHSQSHHTIQEDNKDGKQQALLMKPHRPADPLSPTPSSPHPPSAV